MLRIFLVLAALCAAAVSPGAYAQGYTGLDHINRIIAGTPGITTVGLGGGSVAARATGSVNLATASGLRIPIPVAVEAQIGGAAIAAGAARVAARAIPWVGAALLLKDIYDNITPSTGLVQCPGGGVCKQPATATSGVYKPYPDPGVYVCNAGQTSCTRYLEVPSTGHGCAGPLPAGFQIYNYRQTSAVPCGWVAQGNIVNVPLPAATPDANGEADVAAAVRPKIDSDPNYAKKIYDYLKSIEQQNPSVVVIGTDPLDMRSAPILLNSGAVATDPTVISTTNITNPDGTTSTVTKTQVVTVSPTVKQGATVGDPQIDFPYTIKITTETVNNSTGEKTTEVKTDNMPGPGATTPLDIKLPTDYNREATQQAIQKELEAGAAPALPDQAPTVKAAQDKATADFNQQKGDVEKGQDADKSKFFSWVWTPPVGTCSPYPGSFRGYSWTWDLCPTIANIRDVLGWLLAIFSSLTVYGVLFKKGD